MADIIPPRRDELLTPNGAPTNRFIRYLEALAAATNETQSVASKIADNSAIRAQLKVLQQRLGSGNPLTWDETGFTWDSTKHSFDQTEA